MFGKDFKEIPVWTDVVKYKGGSDPTTEPNTSNSRDKGVIRAPDGMSDRERLDAELMKLIQGN